MFFKLDKGQTHGCRNGPFNRHPSGIVVSCEKKGDNMKTQFRNLIFEGGGVKGIAYVGAMQVLEQRQILKNIKRVGGTSAGAINALLFALGYTIVEQRDILNSTDFKEFMDD